jgi:type IV fimbrial biogenesis protein FimT
MKSITLSELFSPRRPIRDAGFTLLELMVTMTIIVVLLGIGVPSFRSFVSSQRVKSAASEVSSMLILARSEAIKRNRNVIIDQATGGWQNGWAVSTTSPAGIAVTLNQHEAFPSTLTVTNATTSLSYNGNGRLTGAAAQFTVQSTPATHCATIRVTVSGMPTSKIVSC